MTPWRQDVWAWNAVVNDFSYLAIFGEPLLFRRKKNLLFYIYAVIVKQFFYKCFTNHYSRWSPARKEVIKTIKLDCPRADAASALVSHPQGARLFVSFKSFLSPIFGLSLELWVSW